MIITMALSISVIISPAQDSTKIDSLKELKGYSQSFYYSAGQVERAKSVAGFLENASVYFKKELGFTPEIKMYILAPRHWKSFAAKPLHNVYGFPHNINNALVIAAEENDFWRSYIPKVDELSTSMALQVTKAYRKTDGTLSMMPFFDLLALHEMGHSYTGQAGLKMHRHWMGELFVNMMLHTFVAEEQPELLPALETFPGMVINAGTADHKFTNLHDFERLYPTLGMGAKNYGWYQCRLHAAAKEIYNAGGKEVLIKLWKALKKHQQDMTDAQFIDMLKSEVHPTVADVYTLWNNTTK